MSDAPTQAANETPATGPSRSAWASRAQRLAGLALAGACALVAYCVFSFFVGSDPFRPFALFSVGIAVFVAVLLAAVAVAFVVSLILRVKSVDRSIQHSCAGIAIGLAFSGTMDDWLVLRNPVPGPPSGAAYLPLLTDYIVLGAVLAGCFIIRRRRGPLPGMGGAETPSAAAKDALQSGIFATLTCAALAAALMTIFMGPAVMHTLRGQVYFTVGGAFFFGTAMARQFTGVRDYVWYLPAPFVAGAAGIVLATLRPSLGGVYDQINVIPAWALARPLPVEMVTVGLFGVLWSLRAHRAISDGARSQ